jgi:CheY-like chemotaxis protein
MFSLPIVEISKPENFKSGIFLTRPAERTRESQEENLPTILVVDDERLVADTLTEILDGAGYSVTTAYDGWEALELAHRCKPDFLLTDVIMPRMNGVELAIAVRKMLPSTRILLFSGNAGVSELIDQGREQGYDFDTLGKPIHPHVLLQRLSELK